MPRAAKHVATTREAMSVKYNNSVYEKRSRGEDVIVLSLGEAFFDVPLFPFEQLPHPSIYHYSHSRGLPELRELLAELYLTRYGVSVDPSSEVLVTAGSKVALQMAFMAILDPHDEVLIHDPAWVSYSDQVRLSHGVPVHVPYDRTTSDYRAFVSSRTRAVVVNNPHNPTGRVLTIHEWENIYRLAEERDLYVISDEAYSDFVPDPADFHSAAELDPQLRRTIVCNSVSKNFGMSGWRIGYVLASAEMLYQLLKLNQHIVTCAPTVLQWYLVEHFHRITSAIGQQIVDVVRKRNTVASMLRSHGLSCLAGDATFYLFVSISDSGLTSEEFATTLLEEHGVSTVPGVGYGPSCDGFIRMSVGTEPLDRVRLGVERIARLVQEAPKMGVVRRRESMVPSA